MGTGQSYTCVRILVSMKSIKKESTKKCLLFSRLKSWSITKLMGIFKHEVSGGLGKVRHLFYRIIFKVTYNSCNCQN